jgi:hypothetical protein
MTVTLSGPYVDSFSTKSGQLRNTDLYPLFARCMGSGLGLAPGPTGETLDAFFVRVKALLGA